ncbi:MAG: glycosyltransferase [Candidatus Omnitrophica bacterium]|nr:glycosyltransferase [Candidatus Omnitrophota bacterium]
MDISVIIPSYRPADIKECLKSIFESDLRPCEIILVDDCSTLDYFREIDSFCQIIKLKEHVGPAKARNIGACQAKGDIFCFIDSDVKIFSNTLRLISDSFQSLPEIAAVQTACTEYCRFTNFASQYHNLYLYFHIEAIRCKYIRTFIGNCFAVKKEDFVSVGGFNENIKNASVEDGDFGMRLSEQERIIYLNKNIKIEHRSYIKLRGVLKRMFIQSQDKVYTLMKNKSLFKFSPDKTPHSKEKIFSVLLSPLLLISSIILIFAPKTYVIFLSALLLYLLSSRQFIYFTLKSKGIMFAIKAAVFYYLNCLVAFVGITWGVIKFGGGNII